MDFFKALQKYLETEKVFIQNPKRWEEVQRATEIANELFSDGEVTVEDDPLQMGALIIRINMFDIVVRGEREINLFSELISNASNFEVYSTGNESIRFSLVFQNVLTRLKGK